MEERMVEAAAGTSGYAAWEAVSYTHLTLPTNREGFIPLPPPRRVQRYALV